MSAENKILKSTRKVEEGAIVSSSDEGTSEEGERLTMSEEINLLQGRCPDCKQEKTLLKGPLDATDALKKYRCRFCFSRFHDMGSYGVERLSGKSPAFW